MMTTTHTITAPSGAVLRITDTDLRRGWTDPRGRIPGMDAKKLIVGTSIEGLCKRGVFVIAAFTEEDKATWERERRHPVPLQSFRIRSGADMPTSPSNGSLTDPDRLPDLLKRIHALADPEMPLRSSPKAVAHRMERLRDWVSNALVALNHNAPRPGLHLSESLAKQLIRLVKEAELEATYGKNVAHRLRFLRGILQREANLNPADHVDVTLKIQQPEDGWGHTTKDASVEDLFREWAASEAGTDRHEQLFRQLMEQEVDQLQVHQLLGQIHNLKNEMLQLKVGQQNHRHHFAKMEEFIKGEIDGLRRELLGPNPAPCATAHADLDSSCEAPLTEPDIHGAEEFD